jgi:hypothetical protein
MKEVDLKRLRALCAQATPAPWRWGDWQATFDTWEDADNMLTLEWNETVGDAVDPQVRRRDNRCESVLCVEPEGIENEADRELIVEARNALPVLLDMIEQRDAHIELLSARPSASPTEEFDRGYNCATTGSALALDRANEKIEELRKALAQRDLIIEAMRVLLRKELDAVP